MSERVIRIHKVLCGSEVEGPGCRIVIWVQGCSLQCKGCFEKDTWDANKGDDISVEEIKRRMIETPDIEGITILGGEPFEQPVALSKLLFITRSIGKNSIVFSGYTFEELNNKHNYYIDLMLEYTDLLVDGRFEQNMPEKSRPLVGSNNQRFLALSETGNQLLEGMNLLKRNVEVRITKEGVVMINGMWK